VRGSAGGGSASSSRAAKARAAAHAAPTSTSAGGGGCVHFDCRECGHSIGPFGASELGSGVGGRRALPHRTEAVCAGCSNDSKLAKCRVKYFCAHCGLFAKKVRRHANDNDDDDDAWRRIRKEVWFGVSSRTACATARRVRSRWLVVVTRASAKRRAFTTRHSRGLGLC
jgi:hypothetical protein